MSVPEVLFYGLGGLSIVSALGMVLNLRNTVASAMSLVVTMISLAAIYVLMEAHLVAAFQIIVYAGAIVVLFLFVVMLLNLRTDTFAPGRERIFKIAGALIGLLVLTEILRVFRGFPEAPPLPKGYGGYTQLGIVLYTDYVLLVEMAGLLLLAAIVGGLILAKKKID